MSKLRLATLFIGAFLTSSILGACISCWTLPPVMAIDSDSFELQLRFLDGTSIEHFDWGEFSMGQAKLLQCQLVYLGTLEVKVMWNTTDFPCGWSLEVWEASKEKIKEWPAKSAIKLIHGEILPIGIVLREVNGTLGQLEAFSLNFMSLSKIKTQH